jgi:hypothetical protein
MDRVRRDHQRGLCIGFKAVSKGRRHHRLNRRINLARAIRTPRPQEIGIQRYRLILDFGT